MKKILRHSLFVVGAALFAVAIYSCSKDFLDQPPYGSISQSDLNSKDGVNGLLIAAYSMLDGTGYDDWLVGTDQTTIWNAWTGSVASDDAHKGGGYSSQGERGQVEGKYHTTGNDIIVNKWKFGYAAVQRANEVIRALNRAEGFTDAEKTQVLAEARFLRGFYHFEVAKMFWNVPFIGDTVTFGANNYLVTNRPGGVQGAIWPRIEEDLQFAIDNLPATQAQIGRTNSWAAKAMLAKTYMQQGKMAEAKPILTDIIANGVTQEGVKYDLNPQYSHLWRAAYENDAESVFAAQMSVNDGGGGRSGNDGEINNYPDAFGGWGHQPSFNLVNAFKTVDGYPMFDTFNDVDVKNNMGIENATGFVPYTGTLDPRLDWTVGRYGIPYHDWYVHAEKYNPSGGPYRGKKWVTWKSDVGGGLGEANGTGPFASRWSGNNFRIIRFADILLWAAECEVEANNLQLAEDYVNRVRARAANPADFLKTYVDNTDPSKGFTTTNAANYDIALYGGTNGFVAKGQAWAREAVRFERRLEFGTEGSRFFDLQRWDLLQDGYMANTLNKYMTEENAKWVNYIGVEYEIFRGTSFIKDKHEYYPIPQSQVDQSSDGTANTLIQNDNW